MAKKKPQKRADEGREGFTRRGEDPSEDQVRQRSPARPSPQRGRQRRRCRSPKQQFSRRAFGREHSTTTLKVIFARCREAIEGSFQPHPRSQSAKTLIWTFTVEQGLTVGALKGTLKMPPSFAPPPETLAEAIMAFERAAAETIDTVKRTPDARFHASSPFFTGPGKIGDVPNLDLLWMMLSDQIHHRGQLSVYVRMAGGRVPSIYGPSADEPWM